MIEKLNVQKAAIYIRVSTQWQIDKDSLPMQKEDLVNYVKYALGIDKYEIFEDAGYSAKNTSRPSYQHMMSRVRTGEFSHIVVWKIDRISRNLLDFAEMYSEIKKLGVTFVSKNEQFDTSSAMGEAMLKIILVFAELERNMTSERVTATMISRASNGHWNGGRIPYGYNYDKSTQTFSINEEQAEVVLLIYDIYEKTRSLVATVKRLNEMGIFTRLNVPWQPATLRKILVSEFYIGKYKYNYHDESTAGNSSTKHIKSEDEWIVVDNHHPAIVDPERQENVKAILQRNRRSDDSKIYVRKNINLFAGILVCGCCGSQMTSTTDRARTDGYRPTIYACSRKRRFNDCTNKYVSDVTVGPFILNYIANVIKAQNNFGVSTPIETFERKLLRGEVFRTVDHIDHTGLAEMYSMLKSGVKGAVYSATTDSSESGDHTDELALLMAEKRKTERAIDRLRTLYLYSEDALSEKEFLVEKKRLTESLDRVVARMEEIENDSTGDSITDREFLTKASTFIMVSDLQNRRYVNFEHLVRTMDKNVIKEFINSVIKKIVILDGKIMSIRFKNGIEHKFLYK